MKAIRAIRIITASLLATAALGSSVCSAASYNNYTYDSEGNVSAEPQAYIPLAAYSGDDVGAGGFSQPQDIFVAKSGDIYIADTGNNRVVVLDAQFKFKNNITGFDNGGIADVFSEPYGLFVTDDGTLYIADRLNARIVVLNSDGSLQRIVTKPEDDTVSASYAFSPIKVAVDYAGRIYAVSENCDHGIIEYNPDGSFLGYFGSIKTQSTVWELFWRSIATKSQKEAMSKIVPTEYSNIDVDSGGFVYGTVSAIDTSKDFDGTMFIHRLNAMGTDVLKRNGNTAPMGDVLYSQDKDTKQWNISRFADVAVSDNGIYSALDSYKGRIFTYSSSGELLFVFGGIGDTLGTFGSPSSIDSTEDNRFIVLDKKYNQFVVFAPTEYGTLICDAERYNYQRDYDESKRLWFEALKYTSKSELVFGKIGQLYISEGDYKNAMKYMKLAGERTGYSEAYQNLRRMVMNRWFGVCMGVIAALAVGIILVKRLLRRKKRSNIHE